MQPAFACPAPDALSRLLTCQPGHPEREQLDQHLASCPRCRALVRALEAQAQPGPGGAGPAGAGPAEALVPAPAAQDGSAGFTAPGERSAWPSAPTGDGGGAERYDFLAPAEGEGELGRLGPYRVLRVLGSGGMGVVFEAEDPALRRRVALKVMRRGFAAGAVARKRFLREARATAGLQHDHVVRVHKAGEDRGVLWLAMQLLRGRTLEDRLRQDGRLPLPLAVRLGRELAEGLAAAHARGLLHRDVKPANVWLEEPGGRAKLLDFGLARDEAAAATLTHSGAVVGTPAYMAPEQVEGAAVDGRCDLFSLGCVLYRAATGRPAFRGETALAVVRAVAEDVPPAPHAIDPGLPEEFSALVMHLLEKRPEDRPPSAAAVAAALAALQERTAGPPPDTPRPPRRARANRRRVWAAAITLLLAVIGGGLLVRAWTGGEEPDRGGPAQGNPLDGWRRADIPAEALAWAGQGDPTRAAPDLVGVLGEARFRVEGITGWQAYSPDGSLLAVPAGSRVILFDASSGRRLRAFTGHEARVYRAAFAPDGKTLASASDDHTVRLWDVATGQQKRVLTGHRGMVRGLAYSRDGTMIASGGGDREIRIWNAATGDLRQTLTAHKGGVNCLAFNHDGTALLSRAEDETARLWDVATGRSRDSVRSAGRGYGSVAYSPDGSLLAVGGEKGFTVWEAGSLRAVCSSTTTPAGFVTFLPDGKTLLTAPVANPAGVARRARLWDARTGKEQRSFPLEGVEYWQLHALSPDGRTLSSMGEWDSLVLTYDVATGERHRADTAGHTAPAVAVAVRPDGKVLASSANDGTVRLWDLRTGKELRRLTGHTNLVRDVAFSPDGALLASASSDRTVKLWDPATGRCVRTLGDHDERVERVAFSPDGSLLASAGWDGAAVLCEVATGLVRRILTGHDKGVTQAVFSPDGRKLATASWDGTARVWDVASGRQERLLRHTDSVLGVAFLPDGQTLAAGGHDHVVTLWRWDSGEKLRTLAGPGHQLHQIALRPDGRVLAACGLDGTVRLWDLGAGPPRGREIRLRPFGEWVSGVTFTPDGRYLVVAGYEGLIYVVRPPDPLPVEGAGLVRLLQRHDGLVHTLAVLPDGKQAVSYGEDDRVRLWDLASGAELRAYPGPPHRLWTGAFAPDGRHLLAGGRDGRLRLWDFVAGKEAHALDGHKKAVNGVALSADRKTALSGDLDGTARLWDLTKGAPVQVFAGHEGEVYRVALSPDGRRALTAGSDRTVRLWDTGTGKELWKLDGYLGNHASLCFSPDGQRAAWAHADGTVRVWAVADGKELRRFPFGDVQCFGIAFSPDGRRLLAGSRRPVAGSNRGLLVLWDVESGRSLLRTRAVAIYALAFTPDGSQAVTGHWDGRVGVWRLPEPAGPAPATRKPPD
jgi:WD40 repeat protein